MPSYSIATQWDTDAMLEIINLFDDKHRLHDIYGSVARCPIGHGRPPEAVPDINLYQAKKHIEYLKSKGVLFNYLLNGAFDSKKLSNSSFYMLTLNYVRQVIEELEVEYVTVAVPELVELINKYYPNVSVKISTIYNALTVQDLQRLDGLKFDRVVLGNDASRNPKLLAEALKYSKEKNFDLEMLITETCLYKCNTRYAHYHRQTENEIDPTDWYMNNCTLRRILHPEEFLKSCWVRPEDISYYCDMGITNFKISGRSKTPEWTKRCLASYIRGEYAGNFMEILGTTPPNYEKNSEYLFSIDNGALHDFIANHPMDCYERDCLECKYCEKMTVQLFTEGSFTINKLCGDYNVVDGHLVCEPGLYTRSLIDLVESKRGL